MAKLITTNIPAPDFNAAFVDGRFDSDKYEADCQRYINELVESFWSGKDDDLVGEIIRFQRGDGYAEYMIAKTEPLELIHLEAGDAWEVEPALIRGLNLADVSDMVERERRIRDLFARR